ncbi:MAG: glycosyltransferase family 2 protein [Lachnospiraceae bacterium]|nr:glycosyltransferase family 2 protein [Lachnospiraceae bacterium]
MKKTTVVIPNLNGEKYIRKCLGSIDHTRCDVIVVDNGSADNSLKVIREEFPGVTLLENKSNTGFCRAVNQGVKAAQTEYVFLLNNDAFISPDCIGKLERFMDDNEKVFSCQARVMTVKDPDVTDDSGDRYSAMGWAYCPEKGLRTDRGECIQKGAVRVFSCCACAAMYRRDVWESLGGMDERHFAYLEDTDIGWRAAKEGYANMCLNSALAWHVGSASSGSRYNTFKAEQSARNSLFVIAKNMTAWQKFLNFIPCVLGFALKICFYARQGLWRDYLKGLFEGAVLLARTDRNDIYFSAGKNLGFAGRLKNELILEGQMIAAIPRRRV